MALLGFREVTFGYGGPPLLDGVNLQIEEGERIGLLGRNGAGKSTLLRLLQGVGELDGGEIVRRQGLRVAGLAQEVPRVLEGTVGQQVLEALDDLDLAAWDVRQRVDRTMSLLALDGEIDVATLSAGSKRRVLLARALVADPDVLVLDEPTNHLDIEAILRLEEALLRRAGALVFVTHDRAFLRRLATRILDLDRGDLRSYACDYGTYLDRRAAELEADEARRAVADKKLAQEEAWIRRGVKARRARNQGRVRALQALRSNRRERRERLGSVRAVIQDAERTGDLVIRAEGLRVDLGGRTVIRDLDLAVMRGDRVGIVGPNGCGKTTLLRLLLGDLVPDEGTVRHGTNLQIARFDQLHDVLDLEKSLHENVCDEGEWVTIGGERRHVIGYLQDFLFTSDQIRGPVKNLSGGERNRAQLARILARPCNVLVLDEPTNDLDVETLELLESLLAEFGGTLLLVSHDREFLDQVVTSTLVFEGESGFKEYGGGYADWVRERMATAPKKDASPGRSAPSRSAQPRRLSYQEKRELEGLPARIEALESERERVFAAVSAPDFYRRAGEAAAASKERLQQIEHELEAAFGRWEQLERIADGQG